MSRKQTICIDPKSVLNAEPALRRIPGDWSLTDEVPKADEAGERLERRNSPVSAPQFFPSAVRLNTVCLLTVFFSPN
jgi:hypothetical protein